MRKWADLMATSGQFYWPSVGNFVAAYGQFFMAAYRPSPATRGTCPLPCVKRYRNVP
ncbi:hypothetical protein ARTHRO8AJ_40134 [Arthrobacter sp. 8AJ]|nr:hypothetical protein ARTHRO8AJ_40134 [Arthrobacter sp. 8AJ]